MGVNKVIYGGDTLIDLSNDTITADKMLSGITGHDKAGNKITGTIENKTSSNLTASGATVTVPAGYYASQATKSVSTATQATPSISVDSAGKITASATQSAGYVSAGTKSGTKQLTTQAAKTVTPSTSEQIAVASSVYTTGEVKVAGDANLLAENIKSGISIFGVAGTLSGGAIKTGTFTPSSLNQDVTVSGLGGKPKQVIVYITGAGNPGDNKTTRMLVAGTAGDYLNEYTSVMKSSSSSTTAWYYKISSSNSYFNIKLSTDGFTIDVGSGYVFTNEYRYIAIM